MILNIYSCVLSIIQKHFDKAVELISNYDGRELLQHYLKKYFATNKQHGSKDRKTITHFCYTFFRIGKNLPQHSVEQRLRIALFICENLLEKYVDLFSEEWCKKHVENMINRIRFIQKDYPDFSLHYIFPYEEELSESIDATAFQQSFLVQPKVFLRIRKGKRNVVVDKLQKGNIAFKTINEDCIAIEQGININTVLELNKDIVVQDLSSQKIKSFLKIFQSKYINKHTISVWDCCAASGGKSILAKDVLDKIDLTVSDIRPQILYNLKLRFREAEIDRYKSFLTDVSKPVSHFEKFDLVICDVPCSGSGTWSRTPETLALFDIQRIEYYHVLQRKVIDNTISHVASNGYFLYITCSVFTKENEAQIKYIIDKYSATCIKSAMIKGYTHCADSMFAALLYIEK